MKNCLPARTIPGFFSNKARKYVLFLLGLLICTVPARFLLAADAAPLIDAAIAGNLPKVKMLLDKGTDVNAKASDGSTPLIYASQNGRMSVVEALLKKAADVNLPNNGGSTAVGLSSFNGYTNIVKILLDYGAKVEKKDANGKTALFYASLAGNDEIVKMLLTHGANAAEKTERSKYIVKGVVTRIDVPGNKVVVRITDGAVVGAGTEVEFGVSENSRFFGGVSGVSGVGHLKLNDSVSLYYSGKLGIGGMNYATGTASGTGFSYTASVISILSN